MGAAIQQQGTIARYGKIMYKYGGATAAVPLAVYLQRFPSKPVVLQRWYSRCLWLYHNRTEDQKCRAFRITSQIVTLIY